MDPNQDHPKVDAATINNEPNLDNEINQKDKQNDSDDGAHFEEPSENQPEVIFRSKDQIQEILQQVESTKKEANDEYKKQNFLEALNLYSMAINKIFSHSDEDPIHLIRPDCLEPEFHKISSVLFSNRGLCFKALNEVDKALDMFSKSLRLDENFSKAIFQRLCLYTDKESYIEAWEDYQKLKQVDPSLLKNYKMSEYQLQYKAEVKKKEMTEEMMGKLKDVGNQFLGMFGLSTDNFKVQQGSGGGYNIQFQN